MSFGPFPITTTTTPVSFFGFDLNQSNYDNSNQWPSVTVNSVRLWDSGVTWSDINTSLGVFTFVELDVQLNVLISKGVTDFIYTAGKVPLWANGGGSTSDPPTDIGTGNGHYSAFVTAIVNHIRTNFPTLKMIWEQWNEPGTFWNGTTMQLLTMATTAYNVIKGIDSTIQVLGPGWNGNVSQLQGWFSAGGQAVQDIIAYHCYPPSGNVDVQPNYLYQFLQSIRQKADTAFGGAVNQPIWITEGSWGNKSTVGPPALSSAQEVAYLAQWFLYCWDFGVIRCYWYAWNNGSNFGVIATGSPPVATAAGVAYGVLNGWIGGGSFPAGRMATNPFGTTKWQFDYTLAGTPARILFDTAATPSVSTAGFTTVTQLDGTSAAASGTLTLKTAPQLLR